MFHLNLEPKMEDTLKEHGVSDTDMRVISHDIHTKASPRGDEVDVHIRQSHESIKREQENKEKWIKREREDKEFFQNLSDATFMDHLHSFKIYIWNFEEKLIERKEMNEIVEKNAAAEKSQQEVSQKTDAAFKEQSKSVEQQKLAQVIDKVQEIKDITSRLEELSGLYTTLLESSYNQSKIVKDTQWLTPLNKNASDLVDQLKLKNDKPLIDKLDAIIDSQDDPSRKKKLTQEILTSVLDSNELIEKLFHNRATPEEKFKHVAPLREAVELNYHKFRDEGKPPEQAEKMAMKVPAARDGNVNKVALKAAYWMRYQAIDRILKANTNPRQSIEEIFGKSAMKLAEEDLQRSDAEIGKYHDQLQDLVENYNPSNGRAELLELAHMRQDLIKDAKAKYAEVAALAKGTPALELILQDGLKQFTESVTNSKQLPKPKIEAKVEEHKPRKF